jgi:predicted metal-binding protein
VVAGTGIVLNGCDVKRKRGTSAKSELSDAALCELAASKPGVKDVKVISATDVQTAAWVRLKCQYGCGGYGQCLVCPPYTPTPEQMRWVLDCYQRAILIHLAPDAELKAIVVELEREIFLRGAWKAFGLGAGPCYLCKSCVLEAGKCRHLHEARPAMEACGIDVYSTVRRAGWAIEVVRTTEQCPNYFGLVLVD